MLRDEQTVEVLRRVPSVIVQSGMCDALSKSEGWIVRSGDSPGTYLRHVVKDVADTAEVR